MCEPIFVDNKIIAQSSEGTVYAYDLSSGIRRWTAKNGTGNRGSTLEYFNGIIYYVLGNGSRECWGIDALNGTLKFQINCPKDDNQYGFDDIVRVVPQPNGKKPILVLNTYKYAYGYEAVR